MRISIGPGSVDIEVEPGVLRVTLTEGGHTFPSPSTFCIITPAEAAVLSVALAEAGKEAIRLEDKN